MQRPPATVSVVDGHPQQSDFLALAEHEEATPSSFYHGKPVLHAWFSAASIALLERDLHASAELSILRSRSRSRSATGTDSGSAPPVSTYASSSTSSSLPSSSLPDGKVILHGINGFVTSEHLLLWCDDDGDDNGDNKSRPAAAAAAAAKTLAIPYHAISLHAIQTAPPPLPPSGEAGTMSEPGAEAEAGVGDGTGDRGARTTVYLQLEPSAFTWTAAAAQQAVNNNNDDGEHEEDRESLELSLIPARTKSPSATTTATTTNGDASHGEEQEDSTAAARGGSITGASASATDIFEALSRCADLHPDLGALDNDDDDDNNYNEGGGLGGQWITSENAHEFDGDGQQGEAFFERSDIAVDVDVQVYEEEERDAPLNSARTNSVGERLGPGAGTTRSRHHQQEQEGESEDEDDETKWQRTS